MFTALHNWRAVFVSNRKGKSHMTRLLNNSFKDMDRVRRFVSEDEFRKLEAGIFAGKYIVVPSFVDVHVHFREPGFFYK